MDNLTRWRAECKAEISSVQHKDITTHLNTCGVLEHKQMKLCMLQKEVQTCMSRNNPTVISVLQKPTNNVVSVLQKPIDNVVSVLQKPIDNPVSSVLQKPIDNVVSVLRKPIDNPVSSVFSKFKFKF